ncbi:hypothetical protein [Natrinema soli]|uniref:Uncharacterized protein n=1 Tax=Natrinema soli TaxID=1930624 RepID=A0ABD5SS97_9EURY|nr:hypothetical protein [Natrinema soli]
MACTQTRDRYVPQSTWFTLSCSTMQVVTTITLLALSASLLTVQLGAVDDVMLIAFATVGVIVLGLALVRLFGFLETNGVPLLESESASVT